MDKAAANNFSLSALCVAITMIANLAAQANTVALTPVADNTLYESATGGLSGGADSVFFAGKSDAGLTLRGLLRFDVAGNIPAGAVVTSAVLRVNLNDNNDGSHLVNVHRIDRNWGEGTSTSAEDGSGGASTSNSATWIHTFYSNALWDTAGGDFESVDSANIIMQNVQPYDISSGTLILDVQSWLDTPSTNFGWMIKTAPEAVGQLRFDSRESATPANRPTLTIGFDVPSAPAPDISALSRTAAGCSNSWSAVSGLVYRMEFATNIVGAQVWTPVGTVTAATTAAIGMLDPVVTNYRVYRVSNLQF